MAVSKNGVAKVMEPFLYEENGYKYFSADMVEEAADAVASYYKNVYTNIEDCGNDIRRFAVGNLTSKVKKPIYDIYIR